MLGKLFKYEFKNTAKVMLTMYGILIFTTIIGAVGLSTDIMHSDYTNMPPFVELLLVMAFLLYILSIFALFVVTFIYLCIHFYKTMYSDQGYLTHTLPVTPLSLFNVKLVTAWIWLMGSVLLFILSLFALMIGSTRGEILQMILSRSQDYAILQDAFVSTMGMTIGQFTFTLFLMLAFSCLSYLLVVFACLSIGQLFHQHKIAAAIVSGVIIYIAEQIIGSIAFLLAGVPLFQTMETMYSSVTYADLMFSPPMISTFVISALFTIAFYITCIVIQKRHLNLE